LPLLLVVVSLGAVVQGVGHIVVDNGVRWERAQKDAVLHLTRHSVTCEQVDYERYLADMAVVRGFETARNALFSGPTPDYARAATAYIQAGVLPWEAAMLVRVLPELQVTSMQQRISALWPKAKALARDLETQGTALHALVLQQCLDPSRRGATLAAIYAIDDQVGALRMEFSQLSSVARWRINVLVLVGIALLAAPLTVVGYWLSARLQRGAVRATHALAVSEQRLKQALIGSGYGLWEMAAATDRVHCSAGTTQMLGLGVGEQDFTREQFAALVHLDDRQRFDALVGERMADGERLDVEIRLHSADGGYRWFRLAGQAMRLARGQPQRLVGSILDVNERRVLQLSLESELDLRRAALLALQRTLAAMVDRTRDPVAKGPDPDANDMMFVTEAVTRLGAQLRDTNAKLQAILELSPDGFVSFDEERRVGFVSPRFVELTGLATDSLQGADEAAFLARLKSIARSPGELPGLEALRLRASDEPLALDLATDPPRTLTVQLRSGDHEGVKAVLCLRDVTREREVDRLKSEFLTLASHELRTPMTSIFGYVELMLRRNVKGESVAEVQQIIHRQCKLMISILDDLMDLSRLEARRGLDLQVSEVDLSRLLQVTAQSLALPEGREPPSVATQACWPLAKVAGDADRLTRVFINLLSNAYKYSPAGGNVAIEVGRGPGAGGFDEVRVSISDQGMGMSPAQLARVGERFYRADASGNIPGTGLGISIVNEIVKLHGGRVAIASTVGQGTRVDVFLPAQASSRALSAY
jgi:signal transduction histidine kinase